MLLSSTKGKIEHTSSSDDDEIEVKNLEIDENPIVKYKEHPLLKYINLSIVSSFFSILPMIRSEYTPEKDAKTDVTVRYALSFLLWSTIGFIVNYNKKSDSAQNLKAKEIHGEPKTKIVTNYPQIVLAILIHTLTLGTFLMTDVVEFRRGETSRNDVLLKIIYSMAALFVNYKMFDNNNSAGSTKFIKPPKELLIGTEIPSKELKRVADVDNDKEKHPQKKNKVIPSIRYASPESDKPRFRF